MKKIKILEIAALCAFGVGFAVYLATGSLCTTETLRRTVVGDSMKGAFENGDSIKIAVGYYDCHEIKRGDIVAYRRGGSVAPVIKRVVAIPGDTWSVQEVDSKKGLYSITVNGQELQTTTGLPYRIGSAQAKMLGLYASPISKDAYMILGNLVGGTEDSTRFGLVGKQGIVGKVL